MTKLLLTLLLIFSPLTTAHAAQDESDLPLPWVTICSASGIYYLNMESGEKEYPDNSPQSQASGICHLYSSRRDSLTSDDNSDEDDTADI